MWCNIVLLDNKVNFSGILRVPRQVWIIVVLWLGLHPHGLHPGRHPRHLPLFHLHHHRQAEDWRLSRGQKNAQWKILSRHWPLHSNLHSAPVLLLHGPVKSCRAAHKSIWWWWRGLWAQLAHWQTRKGIILADELSSREFLMTFVSLSLIRGPARVLRF